MRTIFRDNGLTIALMAMFLFSALGMIWSGKNVGREAVKAALSEVVGQAIGAAARGFFGR
ncbi:hypothetical protein [Mesorhizobium ventifaucium]|uniref:Uncharacterized protein n=1 Tax=Mesorhizobium ventifaucium TaxID=666020 RepID=A0ABM9DZ92_9HYPH|nr:hypothetical protein [Mesorhizobium ventifaucium]CAH2402112.1 hypothetical protein MES4922_30486 [Mesorhizobium ventifaucium]